MSYNINEIIEAYRNDLLTRPEAVAAIKAIIAFRYPVYPPGSPAPEASA